jgi:large subunit ribosomal protein L10
MTKDEKKKEIDSLTERFATANFFYVTDSSSLSVGDVNKLRRACFKAGIEMRVAKNTFIRKALEANNKITPELETALHGPTAILFSDAPTSPAKLIKDFRKTSEKPVLKAAWIDASVYMGDNQVAVLAALKTKEELIGEIIGLLQSPAKNVISGLLSGGQKLSGILKTLETRNTNN